MASSIRMSQDKVAGKKNICKVEHINHSMNLFKNCILSATRNTAKAREQVRGS